MRRSASSCGAASPTYAERKTLRRYEALLPDYEITVETWEEAIRLADRSRAAGVTVPLADLLIFACATLNELEIAHDDDHFEALAKVGPQKGS